MSIGILRLKTRLCLRRVGMQERLVARVALALCRVWRDTRSHGTRLKRHRMGPMVSLWQRGSHDAALRCGMSADAEVCAVTAAPAGGVLILVSTRAATVVVRVAVSEGGRRTGRVSVGVSVIVIADSRDVGLALVLSAMRVAKRSGGPRVV